MNFPTTERIKSLRNLIDTDSFVVLNKEGSDVANLYYLTGFRPSLGALIVAEKEEVFLTDSRYIEAAREKLKGDFEIRELGAEDRIEEVGKHLEEMNLKKAGVDAERISLSDYRTLQKKAGENRFDELEGTITELRKIKDENEIELQAKAAKITDRALRKTIESTEAGATEKEVASKLEEFLKKEGAESVAFGPIVASGVKSSRPHAKAGSKKLREGELLLIDVGAKIEGYSSDMTRTFCLGEPTPKQKKIYRTVLKAQKKALKALEPGKQASDLDRIARDLIKEAGYGDNFGHGLGHGVGLEVHEKPGLSPKSDSVLEPGMIVTVEPGIYLSDWGGVRIEDMVVLTSDGNRKLSGFPKEELKDIL